MALGVAAPLGDLLGLDHLDDRRAGGIRLGVDDVDARRPEPRHHQVPPLDMRVRGIGAEHRTAGVPAEVVELVPRMGHLHLADHPAVFTGTLVHVDDADRSTAAVRGRVGPNDVRQLFRRGLGRHPRRRIKTRVGSPHGFLLLPELVFEPRDWSGMRRRVISAGDRYRRGGAFLDRGSSTYTADVLARQRRFLHREDGRSAALKTKSPITSHGVYRGETSAAAWGERMCPSARAVNTSRNAEAVSSEVKHGRWRSNAARRSANPARPGIFPWVGVLTTTLTAWSWINRRAVGSLPLLLTRIARVPWSARTRAASAVACTAEPRS